MKTAKLFMNGQKQAVWLPEGFQFKGNEVFIKRVGDAVVLLPHENCWGVLLDSLERFTPDYMVEREQPCNINKSI